MPPNISPAEWEVLNALWNLPPTPVATSQIVAALAGKKDWHPKTVQTFLTRLVKKGVLRVRRHGKINLYLPLKSRQQCVRSETTSFLQRVFAGASAPMLLHFVEEAELSRDEIRDLERLLKQKKK